MTAPTTTVPRHIASFEHLCRVLGIPFSDEQREPIVADRRGTHAIIAGAGSGKTAVMAARVVWLVGHEGVDPERILGLTFTKKAAGELAARVRSSLRADDELARALADRGEPTVATYHSFAGMLIAEHGMRLGLEPDLRVLADATRHQLVIRMLRRRDQPLHHVSAHLPTLVGDILALDGELSEHVVATADLRAEDLATIAEMQSQDKVLKMHEDIAATCHKRIELSHLVDEYREAKRAAGVMDFSDQMAWGKQLAEIPEVRQALRERYDVVLLDEYQDTSVAQRDLLKSLFAEDPEIGLTAVGDPAQGIYGWRGAAAGNLEGFLDDFGAASTTPFSLAVSRRCGVDIIDFAGHIAREYYQSTRVVTPLAAAPDAVQGKVTLALHETVVDEIGDLVRRVGDVGRSAGPTPVWNEIGVLVRNGKENAEIVAAFRSAGIPVEIVGLKGLLVQPEVLDLLSVLEVVDDMTANPALLRLLAGPRWRIGDRDLALLGRRADILARALHRPAKPDPADHDAVFAAELDQATAGVDPTEVVSLAEAVEDPGHDLPFSDEARARFAELARLLAHLRAHRHEPLLDLARRALHALHLDVELDVAERTLAGGGAQNLTLLFDTIAGYASSDPFASLGGLLSYLRAEQEYNDGLDVSAPSDANSVKLLTIHKSKGLEYDHVFVPFVSGGAFPSDLGRGRWIGSAKTLPVALRGDRLGPDGRQVLADITEFTSAGKDEYAKAAKAEAEMEEVRLAYVAFTRARHTLHVSGHHWSRTRSTPCKVSRFMSDGLAWLERRGARADVWADVPEDGTVSPLAEDLEHAWPVELQGMAARRALAQQVQSVLAAGADLDADSLHSDLAGLAEDLELLVQEAVTRADPRVEVPLPETLSATSAMALAEDEDAFARALARPLPRKPSRAARFGTNFHAWIESRYEQQPLIGDDDLPGRGDADITSDAEIVQLQEAFNAGPFAERVPHAIEVPFALMLGGQQLIGRIDAVFRADATASDGVDFEVVDWKTNRAATADPLQLAIYRLAWAEQQGIDPTRVRAGFYYVRLDEVVWFDDLPDRAGLAHRLGLTAGPAD